MRGAYPECALDSTLPSERWRSLSGGRFRRAAPAGGSGGRARRAPDGGLVRGGKGGRVGDVEPQRFHHAAVLVSNLDRAEGFYAGVLGLPVARRWQEPDGSPRSVWLGLGGAAFLALEKAEPSARREAMAPGWHCLALAIRPGERAALRARLERAGYPIERESAFTIYVRDPDGALVGLSHFPEPALDPAPGPATEGPPPAAG